MERTCCRGGIDEILNFRKGVGGHNVNRLDGGCESGVVGVEGGEVED
jgi:hypothetical protein